MVFRNFSIFPVEKIQLLTVIGPNIQDRLFDLILARYPRRADAVEELGQLLNLAKDPIYRRLRGETFLSPSELTLLARRYGISLDALVNAEGENVLCQFSAFSNPVRDFSQYLEGFNADFEQIRRMPGAHLFYASAELPVFTYNFFPELIAFKLYLWGRTTWNFDWLRQRPFSLDLITQPVLRLSQESLQHYLSLNSTELWTVQLMDNTLAQIEYHVYSGGFADPQEAIILVNKLIEWAAHMKSVVAAGRKFNIGEKPEHGLGELHVHYNEMVYTNITAHIRSDVGRMAYCAFCTPNFLKSTDAKLCDYAEDWFHNILSKSIPLSKGSEKERDWYFRELGQKIERRKQRILLYIEESK
jgi:hypothetical protein